MCITNPLSRLSATALGLCAMVLAASPPAFAQTPWDVQDQAEIWGRLQEKRLIRPAEPARAETAKRAQSSTGAAVHAAGRADAAGTDPRHRSGHGTGLRTRPTPEVEATPSAAKLPAPGQPCT